MTVEVQPLAGDLILRAGTPADASACAAICFTAFQAISNAHNFPPDLPSLGATTGLMTMMLSRPEIYSVVAERHSQIVGSNFMWEGGVIGGIGPITVAMDAQNASVGRRMMEKVLERARENRLAGVRLVQAAFHNRSLSLYTKLGFDVREPLATIQGPPIKEQIDGFPARSATTADLPACNRLCQKIHGHERGAELAGAVQQQAATVVERNGRITAYATAIGFLCHAVAETNDDLKALIAAAPGFLGPGFLLPTRNGDVFRWCLDHGLRVIQPMTLMSLGLYNEPSGAFLPSILY